MDVVEGVHQEVRIDLELQVFQLVADVLPLQFVQTLGILGRLVIELHADVHAEHEHQYHQGDNHTLLRPAHGTVRRPLVPTESRRVAIVVCHAGLYAGGGGRHGRTEREAAGTVAHYEKRQHHGYHGKVERLALLIDQQRGQERVVEDEYGQIQQEIAPDVEDRLPCERECRIGNGTDLHRDDRGQKQQAPQ